MPSKSKEKTIQGKAAEMGYKNNTGKKTHWDLFFNLQLKDTTHQKNAWTPRNAKICRGGDGKYGYFHKQEQAEVTVI